MPEPIQTIVTERSDGIPSPVVAQTPADEPNILVQPMPWYQIVLVRAARVYMQSLISFMTIAPAAVEAGVLPAAFAMSLQNAALLAIGSAVMSILHNAAELLTRLDESHPQLRA